MIPTADYWVQAKPGRRLLVVLAHWPSGVLGITERHA